MELVVLGSAGWIPQQERMTTSLALRVGDVLVVLDAGTGVARLLEPGLRRLLPPPGSAVHVFLSHYHLDHTAGLTYLPVLWPGNPTTVYGPVPPGGTPGDVRSVLDSLVGPPFFPHGFSGFPMAVDVRPLTPGEPLTIDTGGHRRLTVRQRAQCHPGWSLGFRVGDALAFMTDTAYDPYAVDLIRGVQVLVHEAWVTSWEAARLPEATRSAHASAEEAGLLAREGGVGELLLSHLPPRGGEGAYAEMLAAARAVFPNTQLSHDGLSRLLPVV